MSAGRTLLASVLTSLAALCAATTGCGTPLDGAVCGPAEPQASAPAVTRVAVQDAGHAAAPEAVPDAVPEAVPEAAQEAAQEASDAAPAAEPQSAAQVLTNTITPRPAVQLTPEQVAELAGLVAELRTSQGTVVIDFLPGKAPGHVQNFADLARSGFYDGTRIHRVIPGLFIQGGDPTGTGDGGPGYFIPAEFNDEPHVRGTVSMARLRHPDSAGSQFFICLATLPYLDGGYTAFGRVLSGDEVLDRIEKLGRATPQGTPVETITLEQVLIRPRSPAERPTASRQP